MLRRLSVLCVLMLPTISFAQPPSTVEAQKEAMKKLHFLAGTWKGPAAIQTPNGRHAVAQTETVQFKVDKLVLLIEGVGREGDKVVFQAMAVLSFDAAAKQYKMRTFTHEGRSVDPKVDVGENQLIWSFDTPNGGQVRYTIRLNDKGQWHEIGEYSQDKKQWRQFFEMTLDKQRDNQ